jgi:hypothetical protein
VTTASPRPGLRDVEPYEAPQLRVRARLNTDECPYPLPNGFAVHSFAPPSGPGVVGSARYGAPFAAAVAKDNVFATQFHPEKSGRWGLKLYEEFVRDVEKRSDRKNS